MASFQGSNCVQERCYFRNVLFEKVKINVFYVTILICSLGGFVAFCCEVSQCQIVVKNFMRTDKRSCRNKF